MSQFKDLFSVSSSDYAKYRPTYPEYLFAYLASEVPHHNQALDVGTGSGQAAVALTPYFEKVVAIDPSENQIRNSQTHPKITYQVALSENTGLPAKSFDLITVAQAFHWFRHRAFFEEVRRLSLPHTKLAIWSYALCRITPEIDRIVDHFYGVTLKDYWEKERVLVEQGYGKVQVPFKEIETPEFYMEVKHERKSFIGYLQTWSAYQTYLKKNQTNPLIEVAEQLEKVWPDTETKEVRWQLPVRLFQINESKIL